MPLYLLEHALPPDQVEELIGATGDCVRRYLVDTAWWSTRSLPLLIAATEVGYGYAGTGTDFWPLLEDRLAIASHVDRNAFSHLFVRAADRYGLARPADTPWNRAFCHIAWPVLHAVMAAELHRPFARCLREVRGRLTLDEDDAALLAPIRSRAQLMGGVRLLAWLEDQHTAASVVRFFMDPNSASALDGTALERIASDLARDEVANTALREARRRQRSLATKPTRRTRKAAAAEIRYAPLVLRCLDQRWSLALKVPQLEQGERESAREALDTIRWRTLFWAQGRPIPSRNLFSDHPIPLTIDALPSADTPLLGDLTNLPISQDAKDFLSGVRVATGAPLLFADAGPEADCVQLWSDTVTSSGSYIVLVAACHLPAPAMATSLGRVADLRAFRIEVTAPEVTAWLGSMGIKVRQSARFSWIGTPELEQHRPNRRFRRGSLLAFELTSSTGACEATLITPDGDTWTIAGQTSLIGAFTPTQLGQHSIRYDGDGAILFDIVEVADDDVLLSVHVDAGTGAITDLVSKGVTLRFDSSASVQEAVVELRVLSHNEEIAYATDILPDTPCRISGEHPIWDQLIGDEAAERVLNAESIELAVSVRGLAQESFRFERVVAPFEWRRDPGGPPHARDEVGELPLYVSRAARPLLVQAADNLAITADIALVRAGRDTPLQSGGLCIGPKTWRASDAEDAPEPDRLLRQFNSGQTGGADAQSVADGMIAWSAAGVDHPVTQYRRGQIVRSLERWLVKQLCGPEWAAREASIAVHSKGRFSDVFIAACGRLEIGFADVFLTPDQKARLQRILLRLINSRSLDIKCAAAGESIGEGLSAELDELFNDAYSVLASEITSAGALCPFDPDEDVDVGETSESWDWAIRSAREEATLTDLLDLLRPLGAGDQLSLADFDAMAPDEVIDLLSQWIQTHSPQHQARAWNRDLVEASYWMLAKPAVAARLSWRAATRRLLADRFSARAIRYAALRSITAQA